jgi:hypothetical protein
MSTQFDPEMIKAFLKANPQFDPRPKVGRKKGGKNKEPEVVQVKPEELEEKGIQLTQKQLKQLIPPKPRKELSEEEKKRRSEALAKGREILRQKQLERKSQPKPAPVKPEGVK